MTPHPTAAARTTLDLDRTVHDLCMAHPDLIGVLQSLGFTEIVKPGMLATAGRFMTIPKGALLKRIPLAAVIEAIEARGYAVQRKENPS